MFRNATLRAKFLVINCKNQEKAPRDISKVVHFKNTHNFRCSLATLVLSHSISCDMLINDLTHLSPRINLRLALIASQHFPRKVNLSCETHLKTSNYDSILVCQFNVRLACHVIMASTSTDGMFGQNNNRFVIMSAIKSAKKLSINLKVHCSSQPRKESSSLKSSCFRFLQATPDTL